MCGSRIFFQGGGSRPDGQKTAWTFVFLLLVFVFVFLVLNLFYSLQRGPMVLLQRKLSNMFQGVQGGPNANFYRDPYNL